MISRSICQVALVTSLVLGCDVIPDEKSSSGDKTVETTGTATGTETSTGEGTSTETVTGTGVSTGISTADGWYWHETAAGSSVTGYEACSYGAQTTECYSCSVPSCKETNCLQKDLGGDPSQDPRCSLTEDKDPETEPSWVYQGSLSACVKVSPCKAASCFVTRKQCEDDAAECQPGSARFSCAAVTQGAASQDAAPSVCGCFETCTTPGESLIVSSGTGTWSDGSKKGFASCSTELPP